MSFISSFPEEYLTDVVVLRGGGRDAKGNPVTPEEISVTDCIVAPGSSFSGDNRSAAASSRASLYRDPDPGFSFQNKDRVRVPEGELMAGEWSVDGRPAEWPMGVEVTLVMS
ncbi:hypothetical protein ACIQTZ_00330 [Paenarthrobacter sp. NPDC090520]|uniref:hypothetical protein n=1 Tax=Paenarthrobacter sp. NPDC090520 TaxID=3364382 RepID=UPI0037F820E0